MPRPASLSVLLALAMPCDAGALDWTTNGAVRSIPLPLPVTPEPRAGFTALPAATTGLSFANLLPANRALTNQILLNGSGVAAGDIDGDGSVDLFFAGLGGRSALWRNLGGWRFENITAAAGLDLAHLDATGCALADLDGDGDFDLLVNSIGGGTAIFLNDGRGHFQFNASAPLLNRRLGGTSIALADLDGDGLLDLYIANYRTSTIRDQPPLQFTLRQENGQPVVAAINGRPLTDLEWTNRFQFACRPLPGGGVTVLHDELGEPDAVFRNLGGGRLMPVPWTNGIFLDDQGAPLAAPPRDWGLSVMIRDLNGDGTPDIYVCNDFASPDRVWFGDGRGHFRAAPAPAFRHTCLSSMGVDVADVNRDGHDDLLVVDMFSREHWRRLVQRNEPNPDLPLFLDVAARAQVPHNTLQLGRGDGTFAEVAQFAGLEASDWSWTPVFLDVDLDGWEDLLVANGFERDNMNVDANRRIAAEEQRLGRAAPHLEHLRARAKYPRLDTPNAAFRNLGGLRFADMSAAWHFDTAGVSQGLCLADLDGDGNLDVILNNFNGPAVLLRNDATAPRVAVRLRGAAPNTRGIGARINVRAPGLPDQSQEMICGGRYLSCDDAMRTFAAGSPTIPLTLEVTWRNGSRTIVSNAVANRLYEIAETAAAPIANRQSPIGYRLSAITNRQFSSVPLLHSHAQTFMDDFSRQPALPVKLSTSGPGVSWIDIDNDGREDLVIAGGSGSKLAAFRNEGAGRFTRLTGDPFDIAAARGQTTVLPWHRPSGLLTLLAGASNYDDASTNAGSIRTYELPRFTNAHLEPTLLPRPLRGGEGRGEGATHSDVPDPNAFRDIPSATGPLAMADVDGDGAPDLFIGGRCVPGRWPEPASSRLFLQSNGRWRLDTNNTARLANIGLVTAAVFSDLDGDGAPDLILACDWGPLRIFHNNHGKLEPWDPPVTFLSTSAGPSAIEFRMAANATVLTHSTRNERGEGFSGKHGPPLPGPLLPQREEREEAARATALTQLTGLWTGVSTGDFDGDGRLDLVAGNWGRNTRYEHYCPRPLQLYYGDLNGDGSVAILEAGYDDAMKTFVPLFSIEKLARSLPWLQERFPTAKAFAHAGVSEVMGDRLRSASRLEAAWFDSTVLLNRGDHFEARPLPLEAQLAPAFGVCVADFDGDGAEDILLAQNFFGVRPEHSRLDAGRGLLLRGDGKGGFTPVPGDESGLKIYGEQRGAAVCDFDGDGRVDLAVGQNSGATELFRNVTARPGLRVRLLGGAGNPDAIGAVLRLEFAGGRLGPARELHAGSGWWSCDSPVSVLARPAPAGALHVRWPGGRETVSPLAAEIFTITVNFDGTLAEPGR